MLLQTIFLLFLRKTLCNNIFSTNNEGWSLKPRQLFRCFDSCLGSCEQIHYLWYSPGFPVEFLTLLSKKYFPPCNWFAESTFSDFFPNVLVWYCIYCTLLESKSLTMQSLCVTTSNTARFLMSWDIYDIINQ